MLDRPGPMSAPFRAGVFQVMTRVAQPVSGFIQFTGNVPLLPLSRFGQYTGSRYQNHQRKQQGSDSHISSLRIRSRQVTTIRNYGLWKFFAIAQDNGGCAAADISTFRNP